MKIGIVGSRERKDKDLVEEIVSGLDHSDIVISGGCVGVDSWAENAAKSIGIETMIFLPDLPEKGSPYYMFSKAYHARNMEIVENSDIIVAFVSDKRKGGTENTIRHARKANVPVIIAQSHTHHQKILSEIDRHRPGSQCPCFQPSLF